MPRQIGQSLLPHAISRGAASVQILLFVVMALGLLAAIFIGQWAGQGNFVYIGALVGLCVAVTVGLAMRLKIWLLIPLCWLLNGKVSVLPLPFSVHDMGVLMAFGMFLFFYAFKMVPPSARFTRYDLLLWVNLAYLVSVYVRNPVGTLAFRSEMIGGRAYVDIIIAVLAYWVLQHITLTTKEGRWLPILLSLGSAVVSALGLISIKIPQVVPYIFPFYSGIEVGAYLKEERQEDTSDYRLTPLSSYSKIMGSVAVAYTRPMDLILFIRPIWSFIFYTAFIAGLISGFRSGFVYFAIFTLISSYFRAGFADIIRIGVAMVVGVAMIMFAQANDIPVAPGIQRALSFIPGPWDPDIVEAADSSTDWRIEMWKIALDGDKYIKNKVFGDGFGYRMSELALQQQQMQGQGGGFLNGNAAEAFLVAGAFHSGPVSSIRVIGAVGLLFFSVFLVANAVYSWKVIISSKGSPFFPLALFIGTPTLYKPIEFWFVFGGIDGDYPTAIFALATLNLTSRALVFYKKNQLTKSETAKQEIAPPAPELKSLMHRPAK